MVALVLTPFTHRPVPNDGTTASFCNKCFATVAASRSEAELEGAEQVHICDPYVLELWKALSNANRCSKPDQG